MKIVAQTCTTIVNTYDHDIVFYIARMMNGNYLEKISDCQK